MKHVEAGTDQGTHEIPIGLSSCRDQSKNWKPGFGVPCANFNHFLRPHAWGPTYMLTATVLYVTCLSSLEMVQCWILNATFFWQWIRDKSGLTRHVMCLSIDYNSWRCNTNPSARPCLCCCFVCERLDIWRDMKPCKPLTVNWPFGGTYRLHFSRLNKPKKTPELKRVTRRWRRFILPKRRLNFKGIHYVISQKIYCL
jgi:hypothetical protein